MSAATYLATLKKPFFYVDGFIYLKTILIRAATQQARARQQEDPMGQ